MIQVRRRVFTILAQCDTIDPPMPINIRISSDKMEAVAEVKATGGEALDLPAIKDALATAGVTYGISDESC